MAEKAENSQELTNQGTLEGTRRRFDDDFDPGAQLRFNHELFRAYVRQRGIRYRECRLSNFEMADQQQFATVQKIMDWMLHVRQHMSQGNGVILFGPIGTGKDHLLTGMVFEAIKAGCFQRVSGKDSKHYIKWQQGAHLFASMRDTFRDGGLELEARLPYTSADLLVLSDVCQAGIELSFHQRQVLYDIVDRRYSNCRPIWLSTNASSRQELVEMIGADIVDRLLHNSLTVACVWPTERHTLDDGGTSMEKQTPPGAPR